MQRPLPYALAALLFLGSNAALAADTATPPATKAATQPAAKVAAKPVPMPKSKVLIRTSKGTKTFTVEVASTPEQQAQGLMRRTKLGIDEGMLFVLSKNRVMRMWMKNTPLPLDMIFIDAQGRITEIYENATPNSTQVITSQDLLHGVLEIPGGASRKAGIKRGDRVIHPAFPQQ